MLFLDYGVLVTVLFLSFSIRLGYWYFPSNDLILWLIFVSPLIAIFTFWMFGLYRSVTRYIGLNALWSIVQAVTLYALIWGVIVFLGAVEDIPRSIVLFNWTLSILLTGGLRLLARWLLSKERLFQNTKKTGTSYKNVLIYGAGDAGIQLMAGLEHSSEYKPVGFIDDSKEVQGGNIGGMDVYSFYDIGRLIKNLNVAEVLIALPSTSRARRINIADSLESYPVSVRMLPSLADLAGGKVSIDDLHKVSIKDLLGRDAVSANKELLSKNITDKTVLVTGAGGSIGSELCRQIIILKPKKLIMYEISEIALYNIEKELLSMSNHKVKLYPILGSVNNKGRFNHVLRHFKIETIYHAAAYKHVPMVEFNNAEGIDNNVFSTLNCAQSAIENGVETFVLISTDKAVRPTNTMGATKRVAELILQALSVEQKSTKFTMVRFGNVLDSSGSVIPLFKQQIKDGGPITVTDKNIIRYFMLIPEAVELVIQAGAMGSGGDVFVLDMGDPVNINDLAKKMIKLSGLELKDKYHPNGDIEIEYIGLRPGEKLYEELLVGDNVSHTDNPLIMRAEEDLLPWNELKPMLDSLKKEVKGYDQEKTREILVKLVSGFTPHHKIIDVLHKKNVKSKSRG